MLQTSRMTSLVDIVSMGLVDMVLLVRVVLIHLVLHAQMMREKAEKEMMIMMSDLCDQMQLAAPLCD